METSDSVEITKKFQQLKEREEQIFDADRIISGTGREKDFNFIYGEGGKGFQHFHDNLEKEIKDLPKSIITIDKIDRWIDNLEYWIKSKSGGNLSETTKVHLKYRKQLKARLIDIRSALSNNEPNGNGVAKEETDKTGTDEKLLTLKQQILLLKALGILDIPAIKPLPDTKQAKLFSHLLNRSKKTVKDHLTYLDDSKDNAKFFIRKEDNIKKINELLKSVGLQEYIVN